MTEFDWRSWVFSTLSTDATVLPHVPASRILGAGALEGSVNDKPFINIMFDQDVPGPFPGVSTQRCVVWVHDEPGDYLRIGTVLRAVRSALSGQVAGAGAVGCRWLGDSQDLSDESMGTITRNATFGMSGLKGES